MEEDEGDHHGGDGRVHDAHGHREQGACPHDVIWNVLGLGQVGSQLAEPFEDALDDDLWDARERAKRHAEEGLHREVDDEKGGHAAHLGGNLLDRGATIREADEPVDNGCAQQHPHVIEDPEVEDGTRLDGGHVW